MQFLSIDEATHYGFIEDTALLYYVQRYAKKMYFTLSFGENCSKKSFMKIKGKKQWNIGNKAVYLHQFSEV